MLGRNNIFTLYFTPTTKTKQKKGHYLAKMYILLQASSVINASRKSSRAETNINTTKKTKLKKGHNPAKIFRMLTHIKLDLYFTMIFCKLSMRSKHPCQSYWAETNINTTTKTLFYNDIPSGIDASLQNLLNRNQYLNPSTKTKLKKGHNSAKIMRMITNIEQPVFYSNIYLQYHNLFITLLLGSRVKAWAQLFKASLA